MKNRFSKLLSVILSVAMVLSMCGITTMADEELVAETTVVETVEETTEESAEEPVEESVEETAEETTEEPVEETTEEPVEETTEEPVEETTEEPAEETAELAGEGVYYVKFGGTGNGLTPETPVATVKDAVTLINAAGYKAGDTVTVYIMNDDTLTAEQTAGNAHSEFWYYDKDGKYYSTSIKNANAVGRFASWNGANGGTPGAHTATLHIKGYTRDAKLFYSNVIGGTGSLQLGGPTIFEGLELIATRQYDCRIMTLGNNVTYKDVDFRYQSACNYSGGGNMSIIDGHYRLTMSSDNGQTRKGHTITLDTAISAPNGDTRYGLHITDEYSTTFTGHVKWYLGLEGTNIPITWGYQTSKFNDGLSIIVSGGTYKHNNHKTNVATVTGGLQVVNNNGASFGTLPTSTITADATWYMNSADTTGNALDVTDTAGTFTVEGGNIAYVVAEDGKSVTYSVNNQLTVPAGTYDVSYAADVATIKEEAVPFADAANEFVEWIDNGAGTLTATYRATGEEVVYYVQHGATGSGLTAQNPGSFATVVAAIEEKYGPEDTVKIKVIKAAGEADTYTDTSAIALASIKDIPAHETTLIITSADTANPTWLTHINSYATSGYIGANIELSGPTILENIQIVDPRMDYHCDLYVNAHNFKVGEGVNWYRPTYSNSTLNLKGTAWTGSINGASRLNSSAGSNFDRAFTMEFLYSGMSNSTISASGYHENTDKNMKQDVTLKFGPGTAKGVRIDGMANDSKKGQYSHTVFDKNVNFVFDGTSVTQFYNTSDGTIVKGAVQIIKNNGATIASNTAKTYTTADLDVETPVYDITVAEGVTLDVTSTAGVYTVEGENIAYAVSEDGETVTYSVDGTLTIDAAGAYTVNNAADIDAVIAALETPVRSVKWTFDKWVDDGEGTLTATFTENTDPEISAYYVQYGATGDGKTYESPIGTIKGAIQAINADGWEEGENVTVYLVPTGNEPTRAQLDYKNTTAGNPPIKLGEANGFISFQSPNVAHKATITYTTYNYGAEGVEKMILANGDKFTLADASKPNSWRSGLSHMYLPGPTVFKDLFIIDLRTDASNDFYTQGHDFELIDCEWRQTAYNASPLGGYTWEDWKNHFYLGNHGSLTYSQNAKNDGVVRVDNPSLIYDLFFICRGEKNGTSYAYFGNDTTASTLPILYNTNNNTAIQHGVANLIFNNTTITKFINKTEKIDTDGDKTADTTVDMTYPTADAVQIILNNGSSITTNTANFNADVYILNVADGGTLDATETAGVYTVDTEKAYVYAYAGGEKLYYAEAGSTLTVDAPGTYQIGFLDDASDVTVVFEDVAEGYVFDGWSDDGKGTLTAKTKPAEDDVTMFYAMYGGTGDGRTPDAPANTVADAIVSINADVASGVLTAGQEVTVYVKSADDWQTYNADVLVGKTSGTKEHHMTAWKNGGGQPAAYSVVLNVQSYDCLNISYMPTSEKLGHNGSMGVNGVTKFDHIAIVDTRFGYREIMAHGHNVTFGKNTVIAHLDLGVAETDAMWGGKFGYDAGNITVGAYYAGTYNDDVVIRIDNAINMIGNDRGVFIGNSVGFKSTFNGNSTIYFNNPDIKTSIQWGSPGDSQLGDINIAKTLNLIFNDANTIYYRSRNSKNLKVQSPLTTANLQIIAKDGITYYAQDGKTEISVADIPANVTVTGGKWILKLAPGLDNFLDVTETNGTFAIDSGVVAVATNDENGAVTLGSGSLILEPGVYTITKTSDEEIAETLVTVTFDGESDGKLYAANNAFALPTLENKALTRFMGWKLNGGEEVLAGGSLYTPTTAGETLAFVSVWENYEDTIAVYLDSVNGNDENDGLTPETAVKTLATAITIIDARSEGTKKIAIIGEYEHSGGITKNTNPIIITGDGSGNSVFDLYNDCIYLGGDIKFENIELTHTTTAGGKVLYSDNHDLSFGEGVVTDSDYIVRLGGDHTGNWGKKITGTFESGTVATLEVGNFWVYTNRATASGAEVVVDGANITTLVFTSNGWMDTQLGNDYTGPVRVTVNSGSVKTIAVTTQADNSVKYTTFQDTVEILANNGTVTTIEDSFTAPNGAWIVKAAKAEDGSYLEYTETKGTYKVAGGMTALAKDTSGNQFVSMDGVLTLPAGTYNVEFVDKIDYIVANDTIKFYSTCTDLDLSLLKATQYDSKAFMGWVYENGEAPNYADNEFAPGDVLVAKYIDYKPENATATAGDFFIKGAQVRLSSEKGNGLRYIVQMNDEFFADLTQYSASIIDSANPNYGTIILPTNLTKGRSMHYDKEIPVEWNLSDGKLGSKDSPYDLDQAHNATPVTTNSVFKTAYKPSAVPAVNTFAEITTSDGDATLYTLCLTNIAENNYTNFYSVRGYIRYIDANGFERVFHSEYYQTNIYKVSNAALKAGEEGQYLTEVQTYVEAKPGEGGRYDAYMTANYANRTLLSGYPTTADTDPNHAMYALSNGFRVREVEINYSGNADDDPVEIVHFADTHLNWINERDLYEALPSTISTYRGRGWLRDGSSTAAISTAMEYGSLFDQIVITGDVMDYFSWGCAEIMEKLIIDRDDNIMMALGNHEPAELMQNDASVSTYYNGRVGLYPLLQELWPNDIYYFSKIIYNDDGQAKAMCVTLNDEQDVYIAEQGTKLAADVVKAREMGIPILIFEHDPISTNNPDADPMWFFYEKGDWSWMKWSATNANHKHFPQDASGNILATKYDPAIHDAMGLTPYKLNDYETRWVNCEETNELVPPTSAWYSKRGAGRPGCDATTKSVYDVIVSNADVIRGVFCGHVHNHMYTEIKATYVDTNGTTVNTIIPQYCVTANAYGNGCAIKISVK